MAAEPWADQQTAQRALASGRSRSPHASPLQGLFSSAVQCKEAIAKKKAGAGDGRGGGVASGTSTGDKSELSKEGAAENAKEEQASEAGHTGIGEGDIEAKEGGAGEATGAIATAATAGEEKAASSPTP